MAHNNKLHALVASWFPEFVRQYGPNFVVFFEEWVKWMETDGGVADTHIHQLDYRDINRTKDQFLDAFHNEFMPSIPKQVLCDRRLLLKHIKPFFRSKGSQKAYRFLFRILYNEEIEFYYPGRDLFRASSAKWVRDKTLLITPRDMRLISGLVGRFVTGQTSGAQALVESIEQDYQLGVLRIKLFLSRVRGTFSGAEVLLDGTVAIGDVISFTVHPGRFIGTDGFASSNKVLQGGNYWHEYSYVIKSAQPVSRYEAIADKLCHPAGTIRFGQVDSQLVTDELRPTVFRDLPSLEFDIVSIDLIPQVINIIEFSESTFARLDFEFELDVFTSVEEELWIETAGTGTLSAAAILNPTGVGSLNPFDIRGVSVQELVNGGHILTGSGLGGIANGTFFLIDDSHFSSVRYAISNNAVVINSPYPTVPASGLTYKVFSSV